MLNVSKIQWTHLGAAILLYATVLIYQGYQYGQGDQSQILPCLYALDHPGAYAGDHFVNQYLQSGLSERTVFNFLFRYLGYDYPWIVWIWHIIWSVALILAWIRIAGLGLRNQAYQYLSIALILILGFHTATGGNEIYYNSVIPSLAAKALGSWAIYFWLKDKYTAWIVLLIVAGFIQPLVGLQLFLLTCLALMVNFIFNKKLKEIPWKAAVIYLLISIPWLYLLERNNGGHIHPDLFMDIMEFRLSHHFFPTYFGWGHLMIAGLFALITMRFYKQRMKWFMIAIVTGCIAYKIGVDIYRQPLALYTQWWKTTIYLEAFAFIVLIGGLEKLAPSPKIITRFGILVPLSIFLLIGFYRFSGKFETKTDYMLPWMTIMSDEVDISIKARELTPENTVFIVPVEFTAFRWYSKRNCYVDYKAMIHQEVFLEEWYQRIQNIYAYSLAEKKSGFDIQIFSKSLLEDPSAISIEYWQKLGISHILSTSPDIKSLKLIGGNDSYFIYSLKG